MAYTQNQVYKPIEVITYFHNSKLDILKFKWDRRVYRVSRIANIWRLPDSEEGFKTHFTVICEDEGIICEIAFYHKSLKWEIVQYDTLV
jgi:hypothetical protein